MHVAINILYCDLVAILLIFSNEIKNSSHRIWLANRISCLLFVNMETTPLLWLVTVVLVLHD